MCDSDKLIRELLSSQPGTQGAFPGKSRHQFSSVTDEREAVIAGSVTCLSRGYVMTEVFGGCLGNPEEAGVWDEFVISNLSLSEAQIHRAWQSRESCTTGWSCDKTQNIPQCLCLWQYAYHTSYGDKSVSQVI